MFVGHYGPAVWDAHRGHSAPIMPVWHAFIAVQIIDFIWAGLTLLGIEHTVAPQRFFLDYSHSLLTAIITSLVAGIFYAAMRRQSFRKFGLIFAGLVFSHWILDFIVHRADMPLYPGGAYYGLGLWDYPVFAYFLEVGLTVAAILFWVKVTRSQSRLYSVLPWVLVAIFALLQYIFLFGAGENSDRATAMTALTIFTLLTLLVRAIEHGRPSKFSVAPNVSAAA